jgi:hypothetical protein
MARTVAYRLGRGLVAAAAGVALLVAAGILLTGCSDDSEPEAASSSTLGASRTTTTSTSAERAPEQVARDFLDAYSAHDPNRALTFLTEEALADGAGWPGGWGSADAFRQEATFLAAQKFELVVKGCKRWADSKPGVSVRCDVDYHAIRSRDLGRGPFTGAQWDLVVDDGKITSAFATWPYITNGFSAQMWEPFQRWVASTHPQDVVVMYDPAAASPGQMTDQAIQLWDERTREWVADVKEGRA